MKSPPNKNKHHPWILPENKPNPFLFPLPLNTMASYLLTNTERILSESSEQLENLKEHALFLIDSVIISLITSACQRKASES
jgi:hypothetical protein